VLSNVPRSASATTVESLLKDGVTLELDRPRAPEEELANAIKEADASDRVMGDRCGLVVWRPTCS